MGEKLFIMSPYDVAALVKKPFFQHMGTAYRYLA